MASIRGKLQQGALEIVDDAAAVAAFVTLAVTPWRVAGFVLGGIALAGIVLRARFGTVVTGSGSAGSSAAGLGAIGSVPAQALLAAGLAGDFARHTAGQAVPLGIAAALFGLLIVGTPVIAKIVNRDAADAANLPGYRPRRATVVPPRLLYGLNALWIAVLGGLAAAAAPAWPAAVAGGVGLALAGFCGAQAMRVRLRGGHGDPRLHAALARHGATFALYFSAPDDTEYHVQMWRPFLERVGRPWLVVTREPGPFAKLSAIMAASGVPVVYCPLMDHLDLVVTPGLRTVLYVNNGMKNTHMVRFNQLVHVQLQHGDSDKASSYNPVSAMYTKVFVAGQAGIDRYAANGVLIPEQKFQIVGRPQAEPIHISHEHIGDVAAKVVLYATTWVSHYEDANYCSLPIGEQIVAALLDRDVTVIMRPHPYTDRHAPSARTVARLNQMLAEDRQRTGRRHVFGAAATRPTLFECINHAHAAISDVSGVASDFLFSGKPLALTDMPSLGRTAFEESFPLARAAYVIASDGSNLDDVLDDLLDKDPIAGRRREVRAYYLGDFEDAGYADNFVAAVRALA